MQNNNFQMLDALGHILSVWYCCMSIWVMICKISKYLLIWSTPLKLLTMLKFKRMSLLINCLMFSTQKTLWFFSKALQGDSLFLTAMSPGVPSANFINLIRIKRLSRPFSHRVVLNLQNHKGSFKHVLQLFHLTNQTRPMTC